LNTSPFNFNDDSIKNMKAISTLFFQNILNEPVDEHLRLKATGEVEVKTPTTTTAGPTQAEIDSAKSAWKEARTKETTDLSK